MSLGALGGSERLFDLFRVTEGKDYIRFVLVEKKGKGEGGGKEGKGEGGGGW